MNSVLEELVQKAETDTLPEAHTSSFWKHHGQLTVAKRDGNELNLKASGFATVDPLAVPSRLLSILERVSYRPVTAQLKSYRRVWEMAKRLAQDLTGGPNYNFSVFRSACVLAVLSDHWMRHRLSPKTFALIGDGFGFLGALIRRCIPSTQLYCIDLPKMLVFQAYTHELADNGVSMAVLSPDNAAKESDVVFVTPEWIERIPDTIDCAVNIASMQEMNAFSISSYFTFLRRRSKLLSMFYCVNRLKKELPGGEITQFMDYPWVSDDEVFFNERCPYYAHFFSTETLPNGPRVMGFRVPFVNHFDGPHMHRLVHLAPCS